MSWYARGRGLVKSPRNSAGTPQVDQITNTLVVNVMQSQVRRGVPFHMVRMPLRKGERCDVLIGQGEGAVWVGPCLVEKRQVVGKGHGYTVVDHNKGGRSGAVCFLFGGGLTE